MALSPITRLDPLFRYQGKLCLVIFSSGQTKVGWCTGLNSLGSKDFVEFSTTSGIAFNANISYLESLEVIDVAVCEVVPRGQAVGVADSEKQVGSQLV